MNIEAITAALSKLGFPIAIAVWLLYRTDKLMVSWIENQERIAVLLQQHSMLLQQILNR